MEGFALYIQLLPLWESFGKHFRKTLLWARPPDVTYEDTKAQVLLGIGAVCTWGHLSSLSPLAC